MNSYIAKLNNSILTNGILKTLIKIIFALIREIKIYFLVYFYKFIRNKTFIFDGVTLNYFYHKYNVTYENERIIVIPIILYLIKKYGINTYTELGNVLSYYKLQSKSIIDKYDNSKDIIKEDITYYKPISKFKNIISISTLEHIGWDESERNYCKITPTFINIFNNVLDKNGYFIFSFPIGYNPYLDSYLNNNLEKFIEIYSFIRINKSNEWRNVKYDKTRNSKFGTPFKNANELIICVTNYNAFSKKY